jgi:hypothetical protein
MAFSKLFLARLIATCKWQPAQLGVACEYHNRHNCETKKRGEIHFQKQAAFCLSQKKLHVNMLMKLSPGGNFTNIL